MPCNQESFSNRLAAFELTFRGLNLRKIFLEKIDISSKVRVPTRFTVNTFTCWKGASRARGHPNYSISIWRLMGGYFLFPTCLFAMSQGRKAREIRILAKILHFKVNNFTSDICSYVHIGQIWPKLLLKRT